MFVDKWETPLFDEVELDMLCDSVEQGVILSDYFKKDNALVSIYAVDGASDGWRNIMHWSNMLSSNYGSKFRSYAEQYLAQFLETVDFDDPKPVIVKQTLHLPPDGRINIFIDLTFIKINSGYIYSWSAAINKEMHMLSEAGILSLSKAICKILKPFDDGAEALLSYMVPKLETAIVGAGEAEDTEKAINAFLESENENVLCWKASQ